MASAGESYIRNVLVVGKSGSGKSTIIKNLASLHATTDSTGFHFAPGPTTGMKGYDLKLNIEGTIYYTNVMDTVGVCGFDSKGSTDKRIVRNIQDQAKQIFTNGRVNLVLFVFREGRFGKEDRKTFERITRFFNESKLSEISALIITHCEAFENNARNEVIRDFKTEDKTKKFDELMGKGVYTVGFPTIENCREAIRPVYESTISTDLATLTSLISKAENDRSIEEIRSHAVKLKLDRFCNIL